MFLPFFGLFYVLKTASFQRFLDITGVAVICGHVAVTLRSRVTATRKFEIVGKWRFLCYEHVTRVLIRVKGVYFACFWHRSNGIYVDFVESHIVRQPYPLTGFCIARIMRMFPWSGSRSNVHDLRPLRSFLSVATFPVLSPASGRESTYPDGRRRVHACGMVGVERSEDRTLPTRVKRRCAVRILSCSLRVLPRPVGCSSGTRRTPPTVPQSVRRTLHRRVTALFLLFL